MNGHAHAGHARGVGHRQVVTVSHGYARAHGEHAAFVRTEDGVGDAVHGDTLHTAQRLDDGISGLLVGTQDDDVAGDGLAGGPHGVHAIHLAARHGDGGHHVAEYLRAS